MVNKKVLGIAVVLWLLLCCQLLLWQKIPLAQKYRLPPSAILLEGYGKLKTRTFDLHYPSGYKLWQAYNGVEAFVTFFHPSSKYSGPSTDGFILRDSVLEMHPP
jgi:hypothetical protein